MNCEQLLDYYVPIKHWLNMIVKNKKRDVTV